VVNAAGSCDCLAKGHIRLKKIKVFQRGLVGGIMPGEPEAGPEQANASLQWPSIAKSLIKG
jgi:hypothetical protein